MITLITSGLITALMSILGKLVTQSFFEAILSDLIIWAGEQLAPMTTNTIDDEIVDEIKKRLKP